MISSSAFLVITGTTQSSAGYPTGNTTKGRSFFGRPRIWLRKAIGLGVWGFRERAPLLSRVIADPYASFLYLGLAVITVATVSYAFATGNDPMVEMFEDVILFSHIGMGLAFFLYVLINFRMPMQRGMAVHKVLFQPR